jgi:hypothetical protein
MSIDSQLEPYVAVESRPDGAELVPPEPASAPVPDEPATLQPEPLVLQPEPLVLQPEPLVLRPVKASRPRPRWVVPAAIAAVGLIASGTLGYLFYSTNARLDATNHALAATTASLDSSKREVASLQADAASKKAVADYVAVYTADAGKVRTDYQELFACQTFGECRTTAQQTLTDLQAFQSDRQAAVVPSTLNTSDGELGDSLSAAIQAMQELIGGMDSNSTSKVDDGYNKLDAAMLSLAKAESALGAEIH